ncbi:MAG: hypothetical protein WEF86_06770 [Gemmatimonadota bacterium]
MTMHGSQLTPGEYAARRQLERRRQTAVLAGAMILSVLLHVVTLLTVSFKAYASPDRVVRLPPRIVQLVPEMQAYDLITVSTDAPPIEAQILERQILRETELPTLRVPAAEVPRTAAPSERISASILDRLRYRMGSAPDVWRPPPAAAPGELVPAERVAERIATTLDQFTDSVAAAASARARALDWTKEDASGGRWGVSPGQIHLGDVTLPLPLAFSAPAGRREEFANRMRSWSEIQDQASRVEAREVFDDRVKAIRERMDRERRARLAADSAKAAATRRASTGGR